MIKRTTATFAAIAAAVLVASGLPAPAAAQSITELLPRVVQEHDRVAAARSSMDATRERVRVARGGWFPQLDARATYGFEQQLKPDADNTHLWTRQGDLRISQLVWDFGATNAAIGRARLDLESASVTVDAVTQGLILEAVSAYVGVLRAARTLGFARQSEENIRRQTGLEEARVDRGAGLSTDVLQAKTQLAGAEARRVRAEGEFAVALNGFRKVFGSAPEDLASLQPVPLPRVDLPQSLDDALDMALDNNPRLEAANLNVAIQREVARETEGAAYFPRVEVVGEGRVQKDAQGLVGYKREGLVFLQATFPFNLGFTAVNSVRAAREDVSAADRTALDTRREVEEAVRNAWQNLQTFRANAELLRNQANIAAEFLELARRERTLGQRSLIDLLSGETALINAQSDASAAEADVIIASYNLLAAMGILSIAQIGP